MQRWEVFMVCLVYLSLCSSVLICSDDSRQVAQRFLDEKVMVVTRIADQATENYNHTCDIVKTCGGRNCSRRECSTIDSLKKSDYSCVYVNNNTRCDNRTGSTCNLIQANFNSGMVRIPGNTSDFEQLQNLLRTTICAQRELDSTFRAVNSTLFNSTGFFYNLYFGSVDGAVRYYPGREHLNADCGTFEPRIRPWYTAAISVLKDVVVILDTGSSMGNRGFLREESSLDIGKSMTRMLVQTLTTGDRVTVIPLRDSASLQLVNISKSQYEVGPQNLDLDEVLGFVENITFSIIPGDNENLASNFTAGFSKALSIFNDPLSPSDREALKIVILITDTRNINGGPPADHDFAAAKILQNSAQLFVYDLSGNRSSGWDRFAACQGTGSGENQQSFGYTVVSNPLLSLSSYFSFLARSRNAANGGRPKHIWAKPYVDVSHLGKVITVSYPAMSSDESELLGVAGLDIQTAGLDPVLERNIDDILSNPVSTTISRYPSGATITSCSDSAGYLNQCSGDLDPEPFCSSNSTAPSDSELREFICCAECTSARRTRRSIILWTVPTVLAIVTIILVLVAAHCLLKRSWNRQPTEDAKELSLIKKFSFERLHQATNKFGQSNIVGKGTFGVVYKGYLGDEKVPVAVKEIFRPADGFDDFMAELKILRLTEHPNLVELKGTCFRPPRCFLVYEFVENGDLSNWLWPKEAESERFLSWNQRRKIARGVACGLNYLHRGLPNKKVFHLDIKPANILLDGNFNAKLADFGISQLYEPGYTFKVDSIVAGTFGYFAPEVVHEGHIRPNSKIDVYSYGMVLLQLITGRGIQDPVVRPNLPRWAKDQKKNGNFERVVDEYLIEAVQEDHRSSLMENCRVMISLALRCLSKNSETRPEMPHILDVIDNLRDVGDLEPPLKSNHSLRSLSTAMSLKSFKVRTPKSSPTSSSGRTGKNSDNSISLSGPLNAGKYKVFRPDTI